MGRLGGPMLKVRWSCPWMLLILGVFYYFPTKIWVLALWFLAIGGRCTCSYTDWIVQDHWSNTGILLLRGSPLSWKGRRDVDLKGAISARTPQHRSICVPLSSHHRPISVVVQGWSRASVAAACPHHHVFVLLQDDVGVIVEVEDRDSVELGRGAARLRNVLRIHQMNLGRGRQGQRLLKMLRTHSRSTF